MRTDAVTDLVLAGTGIATLLAVALFAFALLLRLVHIGRARIDASLREKWWPVFAQAISARDAEESQVLPRNLFFCRFSLLREWCRLRTAIRGSAADHMNQVAERLDLRRLARRALHSKRIGRCLLGIQAVGLLRDQNSWSRVSELLMHNNSAISATAAMAMAQIDPDRAMPLVISRIAATPRWPRTQVGRILSEAGVAAVSAQLCQAIRVARPDEAVRLLQYADSTLTSDLHPVIAEIYTNRHEPELLSAALRSVRGPVDPERVIALIRHPAWHVRMHAATAIGHYGGDGSVNVLLPLLADREWWVRYRTAQAIVQHPSMGPNALRRLARQQTDHFARDIMDQALAERGLA